ncbi:CadC family transcriptional regulator [Enterobacterales bacterium CwR94]|nr:CadC family transcriptional regulator [Enterobacterales bacterium CwR94]
MKYLINNLITFDAEAGTLSLIHPDLQTVQISNPTKRLLLLLIQHQGEAVSRELLFTKVWDDFGMVSSNNNLNQCISKLRRVIRDLGMEDDAIATVPKLGFMWREQIPAEMLTDEPQPEVVPTKTLSAAPIPIVPLLNSPAAQVASSSRKPRIARPKFLTILLVLLCLQGAILMVIWQDSRQERQKIYLGLAGTCSVMVSKPVLEAAELHEGLLDYARRLNPQCASDEYMLVLKSTSLKSWLNDMTRLYFMQCGALRESPAVVCWSLSTPAT